MMMATMKIPSRLRLAAAACSSLFAAPPCARRGTNGSRESKAEIGEGDAIRRWIRCVPDKGDAKDKDKDKEKEPPPSVTEHTVNIGGEGDPLPGDRGLHGDARLSEKKKPEEGDGDREREPAPSPAKEGGVVPGRTSTKTRMSQQKAKVFYVACVPHPDVGDDPSKRSITYSQRRAGFGERLLHWAL